MLGAIIQERNQFASSAVVGEGDLTKYDPANFLEHELRLAWQRSK
jgi:hypothetical protein